MYYQSLIDKFSAKCKEVFNSHLAGVYLHGSMAMNCFNAEKSDIDLIIIVENNITNSQKIKFMDDVMKLNEQGPVKGMEFSIVQRKYCHPFVYPTPFELHFSQMHVKQYKHNPIKYIENMKGKDKDLAAHFTMINHCGIVLHGEPIKDVFGKVPIKDYVDSIWRDIENARKDIVIEPMYMVLNLCRVLAFLEDGLYLSKQQGGKWGLTHISTKYHPLIAEALYCYKTKHAMQVDKAYAKDLADQMLHNIEYKRGAV
ncbi:aminoglycoside adenylyltransferase domain-containing protein [Tetragenococcus halophilus]|uniref:aminoglycoside adenylyltransferase domain-containing protein n=1 Tax=Tetragenococcus halophilus TaxID=51669 RepID=UPI00256306FC|nr:aminoglycoside adenylyltransferase domain-containing protein [Tetragenococcus halophilus]GMG67952.1 DUF4111 domain-containing protein [Tetragenococcus halophilus]